MFLSHMILAFLWTIYCFLHSLLAGKQIKKKSQQLLGTSFKYYRLFYTLFAFLFFLALLYYQISIATVEVFEPRIIIETAGYILGSLGLLIMLYCIKKYFLGLSGVMSLVREEHPTGLFISGIHNYVRHPLYLGTFSFIWGLFLIMPHLSLLVANIII